MKKKVFWHIHEEENKGEQGFLKINNKVIASIASLAALEVKGVARMGRNPFYILKALLSQRLYQRGVFIEFKSENELVITLYIIAEYGANLSELANAVQTNVRSALEKMAEITPAEVNVVIQKVEKAG
ncbi:MAG: Asp23/Gls24 family envelope stress response protein [Candidatus Omnitrophica bacterium]|nr:Asp23/Gls24 family envelope stress response protein [Candidatus Omnitrophota bacterium]MCM8799033.1 Asp23/Gls24 family envelope stress response protein [Candidatus Omnitrophota bacterium]